MPSKSERTKTVGTEGTWYFISPPPGNNLPTKPNALSVEKLSVENKKSQTGLNDERDITVLKFKRPKASGMICKNLS